MIVNARQLLPSNNRFSIYNNDPAVGVGEGINVITGSFTRGSVDLELTSGQGLRFMRSYHSSNATGTNVEDIVLGRVPTIQTHKLMLQYPYADKSNPIQQNKTHTAHPKG
jgi:hypothetical protein